MSNRYFAKFPTLIYNNTKVADITRRVKLDGPAVRQNTAFYPYELVAGQRSDVIAFSYYEDSYMDWLIYHSNGIIDPYYGWYLNEDDFFAFINDKYGSIAKSQQKIKYYQLNWGDNSVDIGVSFYNTALPEVLKKYYNPNYGYGTNQILSYTRSQADWKVNTNRIMNFQITPNVNTAFIPGELVTIGFANGAAEVIFANTSLVTVKNISGNTSANNIVYGQDSGANAMISNSSIVTINITDTEFVYWEPVYEYDYEDEKNEENKFIRLLDSGRALEVTEDVRIELKKNP